MAVTARQSFRVTIATVPHVTVMVYRSSLPGTKAHPHRWKLTNLRMAADRFAWSEDRDTQDLLDAIKASK